MTSSAALPRLPRTGVLPDGLWAGGVDRDPRSGRRGRTRRWSYVGAGAPHLAVGAAVVDLGFASTAFAWAWVHGRLHTWEQKGIPRRSADVGADPGRPTSFRSGRATVHVGAAGDLDLDVPVSGGRLVVELRVAPDEPATCVTPTPAGGWNVTQKVAGERARLWVQTPSGTATTGVGTWRDWTLGAQDRDTTWRWAAAAGTADDGRRVGLNASTGMNSSVGEDVVWWDGQPHALALDTLGPRGRDLAGDWVLGGPGWALDVDVVGVRAADENLLLVRSRYVQPVGTMTGTLPDPTGAPTRVTLTGVTEDHGARW